MTNGLWMFTAIALSRATRRQGGRALVRHECPVWMLHRNAPVGIEECCSREACKTIRSTSGSEPPCVNAKLAMEAYLARQKLRSEAHRQGLRQQFDLHLRDWLKPPLDEISKSMVVERHRSLADRTSTANHTLKYFRTVWNHARRTTDLPESPTMAIEWYKEAPNGSIIEDLAEWRRTIEALPNPIHTACYEPLLFTGFRNTEALTLEWKHVHEDRIHLPMTKNGRSFDLPILQVHHEILDPVRGLHRRWVFPSPKGPDGRMTTPQRMKWSPHAHRRTFATVAMEASVLEEVVGRLLNHTPLSIPGQRYVRPSLGALRPAMEQVSAELLARACPLSSRQL
jgi:integrase